jgi:SAM-dependent methyltransferase
MNNASITDHRLQQPPYQKVLKGTMVYKTVLFGLLILSSCQALTYLCKTKETFKLAELLFLEASLQARASRDFNVTRLLVDQATGSTLFKLDLPCEQSLFIHKELPSSLVRCDWIAQVLSGETDAQVLVNQLRKYPPEINKLWTIGYIRMQQIDKYRQKSIPKSQYTKHTLLLSVSNVLNAPPALDPELTEQELLLVDTIDPSGTVNCYLTTKLQGLADSSSSRILKSKWPKRPFQYSSAINPQVAQIVMDILSELSIASNSDNQNTLRLLDPTCGSGTFLALAIERGMKIEAYDCNENCVDGSRKNLEYLFPEQVNDSNGVKLKIHDSTNVFTETDKIDCVVANLPWGINTMDYLNQNENILRSVRARVGKNTPCAFVTRNPDSDLFTKTGYQVLGQAHVPQRDFVLPKGKKKKDTKDVERNGRNQCVITIAQAK